MGTILFKMFTLTIIPTPLLILFYVYTYGPTPYRLNI